MYEQLFENLKQVNERIDYSIIDKEIRSLVKHFNKLGFKTHSACSGHAKKIEPLATALSFSGQDKEVKKLVNFIQSLDLNLDWEIDRRHPRANMYMLQLSSGLFGDQSLESNEETVGAAYEDIQEIDRALDKFEKES